MRIVVDVKMKAEYIYDLLLFHMYSKVTGFLMNLTGLAIIIMSGMWLRSGKLELFQSLGYIGVGIVVLVWTPINLKLKSKKMIKAEKYQSELQYIFDEKGIEECEGDRKNVFEWNQVEKAISTPKDIAFYLSDSHVCILPKADFKENFMPVMKLIAENVRRDKIYIR